MAREGQLIEQVLRSFHSGRGQSRRRRRAIRTGKDDLVVGIGDDAAVLRLGSRPAGGRMRLPSPQHVLHERREPYVSRDKDWVVTTDAFLENAHFLRKVHPPEAVGYKALARATSDIAAMGARPRFFFLTLGLPGACTGHWFEEFLGGMARAARRFGLTLAGGDTTKYPLVVASLTVMGEIEPGRAVLRSGARPGDLLCVSGTLGEAQLGLELIRKGLHKGERWARVLKKHFYPEPRLALGQWLAHNRIATSMIDTSDGLSTDLGHICKASGVGARVWTERIPVPLTRPDSREKWRIGPLQLALHGGEDYELLFTVPKKLSGRLPPRFGGVPVTVIGEITRAKGVQLVDAQGRAKPLRPGGWDPFRKW